MIFSLAIGIVLMSYGLILHSDSCPSCQSWSTKCIDKGSNRFPDRGAGAGDECYAVRKCKKCDHHWKETWANYDCDW